MRNSAPQYSEFSPNKPSSREVDDHNLYPILLAKQSKLQSRLFDLNTNLKSMGEETFMLRERKEILSHEIHIQKYEQVQEKKKVEELTVRRDIKKRQVERTMFLLKKREEIHMLDEKVDDVYQTVLNKVGGIHGARELKEKELDEIVHQLDKVNHGKLTIMSKQLDRCMWSTLKFAFSKIEQHQMRRISKHIQESKVAQSLNRMMVREKSHAFRCIRQFVQDETEEDEEAFSKYFLTKKSLSIWRRRLMDITMMKRTVEGVQKKLINVRKSAEFRYKRQSMMAVISKALEWYRKAAFVHQLVQRLDINRFRSMRILRKFARVARECLNKLHATIEKRYFMSYRG